MTPGSVFSQQIPDLLQNQLEFVLRGRLLQMRVEDGRGIVPSVRRHYGITPNGIAEVQAWGNASGTPGYQEGSLEILPPMRLGVLFLESPLGTAARKMETLRVKGPLLGGCNPFLYPYSGLGAKGNSYRTMTLLLQKCPEMHDFGLKIAR